MAGGRGPRPAPPRLRRRRSGHCAGPATSRSRRCGRSRGRCRRWPGKCVPPPHRCRRRAAGAPICAPPAGRPARPGRQWPGTNCRRRRPPRCRRLDPRDEPLLHRGVVFHGAVAVEVVLREVDQDADRRIEAWREIDLERGDFDHVDAPGLRRRQRQDRGADIAAELGVVAGLRAKMRDQRRGGRFAVGAGDHDERSVRRMGAPLAAEQLDVADDLDRHGAGEPDRPVRRRMGERHAGRKHQRRDLRPVELAQVGGRNAGAGRILDAGGAVVPAHHVGAAGEQRAGGDQAGTAEAEHGDLASRESGDRDHVHWALRRTMIKPIAAALSLPIFGEGGARLRAGWGEPRNAVPGKDPTLPSIRNRTRPISAPNMSNSETAEFGWTGREKRAAPLRLIASSPQFQCGQAGQRQARRR